MKNYSWPYLFFIFVLGFCSPNYAQDLAYAQFQVIPSLTNPAVSGQGHNTYLQFHHRTQPISASERFTTSALWMATPLLDKSKTRPWANINFSVFNHNQAQLLSFNGGVLGMSYHIAFPRQTLSFGLQGGVMQQSIGEGNFQTRSQYVLGLGFNPGLPTGENLGSDRKLYPILSSGLYWSMKNRFERTQAYFGVAIMNMNRPNISFLGQQESQSNFRLSPNIIVTGAWEIWSDGLFYIQPNFRWINRKQENFYHLGAWFGLELPEIVCKGPIKEGHIKLGVWYYSNRAFTSAIQFEQPKYQISFGYDTPL